MELVSSISQSWWQTWSARLATHSPTQTSLYQSRSESTKIISKLFNKGKIFWSFRSLGDSDIGPYCENIARVDFPSSVSASLLNVYLAMKDMYFLVAKSSLKTEGKQKFYLWDQYLQLILADKASMSHTHSENLKKQWVLKVNYTVVQYFLWTCYRLNLDLPTPYVTETLIQQHCLERKLFNGNIVTSHR